MSEYIFTISPDWSQPVRETLRYLSSVSESYTGFEQRASLVTGPRRVIDYTARAMGQREVALAEALLYGAHASVVKLPLWQHVRTLTADAPAGALMLATDTALSQFSPGQAVAARLTDTRYIELTIAAVSPGALALTAPTAVALPAGTRIYPIMRARLLDAETLGQRDTATAEYALRFIEEL